MSNEITTDVSLPPDLAANESAKEAAEIAKEGGLAESTKRAYEKHFARFEDWCERAGREPLPASVETVCAYLHAYHEARGVSPSTLQQARAAIAEHHKREGLTDPTGHEAVARYIDYRKTEDAGRQKNAASPLYVEGLKDLIRACDTTRAKGLRDRALLLVGYVGAMRRSEIVQIDFAHLEQREGGYLLRVPAQKNASEERVKGIPETGRWTSPANALTAWIGRLAESGIEEGAVFRSLTKGGRPKSRMSGEAVRQVVKARAKQAGIGAEDYSSHSLRAGFLTQASEKGAGLSDIMDQSHHKDSDVALSYIKEGQALQNPAVEALGL